MANSPFAGAILLQSVKRHVFGQEVETMKLASRRTDDVLDPMRRRRPTRTAWLLAITLLTMVVLLAAAATASANGAGSFTAGASMQQGRGYFTATQLLNGNVLIAGGWGFDPSATIPTFPPPVSTANSEIYHFMTGTWSSAAPMNHARAAASAVRLPNGRVLVVDGMDENFGMMTSAEIYHPRSDTWTDTGSLNTARFEDVPAVLLPGRRVLVTGGFDSTFAPLASTEIWNPRTGMWTYGESMHAARAEFATVVLKNGRILVMGGLSGSEENPTLLNSAEIYNPRTGHWTLIAPMNESRADEAAVLLHDGRVLVAGGDDMTGSRTTSSEIYNPRTGKWTMTGSLHVGRSESEYAIVRLRDGRVLLAGGYTGMPDATDNSVDLNTAEVYAPWTGKWTLVSNTMSSTRSGHAAVLLPGNRGVLVMGGVNNGLATATADIFRYWPRH
jgi:N-acetylneuraminic acid mutarotase